jgi:Gpi18-like mannosyltransferase
MESKSTVHYFGLYAMFFLVLSLLGAKLGYMDDINFWTRWAEAIYEDGLGNVYSVADNNYNPLYHYILFLYGKLAGSHEKIKHYYYFLKAFTLIFDFVGAIVAASLLKDKNDRFLASLLLLFNVGYLYNTVVWQQVDAIYTCLTFIAVYFALKQRHVWSVLFYILALNAKLQAIMFLPLLALLWIPAWLKSVRTLGLTVVAAAVLQTLILAPFMWAGDENYLDKILNINFHSVDFYPFVCVNAYNIWAVGFDGALTWTSDAGEVWGKTYKFWGSLMFLVMSFIVLLPMFLVVLNGELRKDYGYRQNLPLMLLTFGLIPLVFCYFNTQMHERYWHSAILFLGAYSFVSKRYSVFALASVAYFLNLESVFKYMGLTNYSTAVFDYRFVALLFGLAILLGVIGIYRHAQLGRLVAQLRGHRVPESVALA